MRSARLTRLRQEHPVTRFARRLVWLIAPVAAALMLAACGSSGSSTAEETVNGSEFNETAKKTVSHPASHPTTTTPPASSVAVPGCRSVAAPASRSGEQAPKPTTQLNAAHTYTVRLTTNCGPILIRLAVKEAPKTTASFAHLVGLGYYNDLTFHRVVRGFVIQGGDPNGDGTGGPSWQVVEPPPANTRYTKGVVAMAKGGSAPSGTSSSQFFIVTGADAGLPPEYALVGHVVGSEKAVEAISQVPTEEAPGGGEASKPRAPMVIEHAMLIVH
jgi:peptidyl-prolyl cis-trans isomerase B (cyclophilin B)